MRDKFLELCKNKEFAEKISSMKTEPEIIALLKENGIDVNSVEELKAIIQPESRDISDDELEQVAGGGLCAVIGIGLDANACFSDGASVMDHIGRDDHTRGFGAMVCFVVGVGLGATTDDCSSKC